MSQAISLILRHGWRPKGTQKHARNAQVVPILYSFRWGEPFRWHKLFGHSFSFPPKNFAPGSPRNDDRQLARPRASPVLSLLKRLQRDACFHFSAEAPPLPRFHLCSVSEAGILLINSWSEL